MFAQENGDETDIMPSGNNTSSYIEQEFNNVSDVEQYKRIAVALISRIPIEGGLARDANNIQLEIVCAKASPIASGAASAPTATGSGASTTSSALQRQDLLLVVLAMILSTIIA